MSSTHDINVTSITAGMSKCGGQVVTTSVNQDKKYFQKLIRGIGQANKVGLRVGKGWWNCRDAAVQEPT